MINFAFQSSLHETANRLPFRLTSHPQHDAALVEIPVAFGLVGRNGGHLRLVGCLHRHLPTRF